MKEQKSVYFYFYVHYSVQLHIIQRIVKSLYYLVKLLDIRMYIYV
jgi:hypothetical protein